LTKQKPPVAWVKTVDETGARGAVARAYDAVADASGKVENLYKAMSLTPDVIRPADEHYLALLHNPASPLEPWLAELVSTYVGILNGSRYAVLNHAENFHHHFGDRVRSGAIMQALEAETWRELDLAPQTLAALSFAKKLSLKPADFTETEIMALREVGFDDTSISYLAQLVASFAYWSRITVALGIRLGDTVGFAAKQHPPEQVEA
jgi:uncharacterized peroxidase-related enzyme